MPETSPALPTILVILGLAGPLGAATVTLSPIKDNTLYELNAPAEGNGGGYLSNGAGEYFFAGRTASDGDSIRRGLLSFDVAGGLPAGASVTSVELTLQMSRTVSGAEDVELRRLLADWGEGSSDAPGEEGRGAPAEPGDATWAHTFFDTDFWVVEGGDFEPTASAVQQVAGNGSYTWGSTPQMVADVQAWLDTPASNFGWLLLGNEGGPATAKRFNSRENGNAGTVPQLLVTFDAPVPATETWLLIAVGLLLALVAVRLIRLKTA